jgi:hypothetical protein
LNFEFLLVLNHDEEIEDYKKGGSFRKQGRFIKHIVWGKERKKL